MRKNGLASPCLVKYDVAVVICWALEKLLAFTTILILLISGTFLFNSAIGFGPGTLDQENPRNITPGFAQSLSISSSFGLELGQQYMQDASNLHSVDIIFNIQPGAPAKVTPVKVCIYQSLSLNFKTGTLLGCVTKNVTEGPAVIDIDPAMPGTQFVENFEFSPNISQTPGVTYVVNVEEDRTQFGSDTQISWLAGQMYNPGAAVPDEVGIKEGAPLTGFSNDDFAFRTYYEPVSLGDQLILAELQQIRQDMNTNHNVIDQFLQNLESMVQDIISILRFDVFQFR